MGDSDLTLLGSSLEETVGCGVRETEGSSDSEELGEIDMAAEGLGVNFWTGEALGASVKGIVVGAVEG